MLCPIIFNAFLTPQVNYISQFIMQSREQVGLYFFEIDQCMTTETS